MGRERAPAAPSAANGKGKGKGTRDELKAALDGDDDGELRINQAFAKRFQHNKERDELQRLQARLGDEDDSDDSDASSEDEEGQSMDVEFAQALERIKKKDPTLYQADTQLFQEEDDDDEQDAAAAAAARKAKKKEKPVYLKDVLAKRLLEDGAEAAAADDDSAAASRGGVGRAADGKSYQEEQEELRAAFLGATGSDGQEDSDEEGEFMRKKSKTEEERRREAKEDAELRESSAKRQRERDAHKVLSNFFGQVEHMDSNEAFLRDYILNKGWLDKDQRDVEVENHSAAEADAVVGDDDDDDEEELDKQDAFEAQYNFRFEEPGSERIVPHPRIQEHSIRKEETKRKRERAAKKEREAADKQRKREELLRLKALKRQELNKKLELIQQVAGKADLRVDDLDMEEDFDSDAHDRRMAQLFDDQYYAEGEGDDAAAPPEFGDLEEELAELIKADKNKGFQNATRKLQKKKPKTARAASDDDDDDDGSEEEAEGVAAEGDEEAGGADEGAGGGRQRIGKRAAKRMRKEVEQHIEEYYKLDYEDLVGGQPCRFRYKSVLPKKYGLKTEQVLAMSDKELNQVVSLKHLAPYRDESRDRKWFAPVLPTAGHSVGSKGKGKGKDKRDGDGKRTRDGERKAVTTSAEDAAAEHQAARLMSYEVPKVGKHKSVTALSEQSKQKLKVKKKSKARPGRN